MDHNDTFYGQIEAYLSGRLDPAQQEAMQNAIRQDAGLAREVELRRLEFDVSEAAIAQNIRDQLRGLRTNPPSAYPSGPSASSSRRIIWVSLALAGLIGAGLFWWQTETSDTSPGNEPAPLSIPEQTPPTRLDTLAPARPQAGNDTDASDPKNTPDARPARRQLAMAVELYRRPEMETIRGVAPAAGDDYEQALAAWEKQDYEAVIQTLQNFPSSDPKWIRALNLRAHAQFNLKRYAPAALTFSTISDSRILPWSEEADWYVLLALLADGKAETAGFRNRLEKLLADTGHPYFEKAQVIRKRLHD